MLAWAPLRNVIASFITTLDTIESCHVTTALDYMLPITGSIAEAADALALLERKGLVVFDATIAHRSKIVAITDLGRALASDIRHVTNYLANCANQAVR